VAFVVPTFAFVVDEAAFVVDEAAFVVDVVAFVVDEAAFVVDVVAFVVDEVAFVVDVVAFVVDVVALVVDVVALVVDGIADCPQELNSAIPPLHPNAELTCDIIVLSFKLNFQLWSECATSKCTTALILGKSARDLAIFAYHSPTVMGPCFMLLTPNSAIMMGLLGEIADMRL